MFEEIGNASLIVIEKIQRWMRDIVAMLPNFVIAVIILILFYLLTKVTRRVLHTVLDRMIRNKSVVQLISAITSILIFLVGLMVALGVLNLDKTVTSVLAGIGVVGLALGFAFQDAAANLIAGISMAVKSPIFVGDIIESNGMFGTVQNIGLRDTVLKTPEGQNVIIPNRLIFQNFYIHYTVNGRRMVSLECGISYGDDLALVKETALAAIQKMSFLLPGTQVEFFYTEFGDSSINFIIRYWVKFKKQTDYLHARSEGVMKLKEAFDAKGITIPFPIRTLDFGIKGGEKLSEVIRKDVR